MNAKELDRLAELAGIEPSFTDFWGRETIVSPETKRALLEAMQFDPDRAAPAPAPAAAARAGDEDAACFLPPEMERGRIWALAVQLYGVRSNRNWGMGDFTDLRSIAQLAGRAGAGAVAVNPLHELHPSNPASASPYAPSSRLFLNGMYVDPAAAPEASGLELPDARALAALRSAPLIDYEGVARLRGQALEQLYAVFRSEHAAKGTARAAEFRRFVEAGGAPLEHLARYEALAAYFRSADPGCYGWQQWPGAYRAPDAPGVAAFARENAERVEFYAFVQFLAQEQLAAAAGACAGMPCGIYRDLAVGVELNGADAWADQHAIVGGASLGAPPDPLNALGQNWGLPPLSPHALRERAYEPFARLLRANMQHAGALRIDHVMALTRCFWIPRGAKPVEGAYVRYPLADLLQVLARESRRNRCVVVGEDLGTVPPGFRERLKAARVLSSRLVYFERSLATGAFAPPSAYPHGAAASVGTHDLPPLGGWWLGDDIALRVRIGLYPDERSLKEAGEDRWAARFALVDALAAAGAIGAAGAERLRAAARANGSAATIGELVDAVHRFLAMTPSAMDVVQLEDVLGEVDAVNVPGTVNEHPNWRRKRSLALEEFDRDGRLARTGSIFAEVPA